MYYTQEDSTEEERIRNLEFEDRLALARLGVAEDLRWPFAFFAGVIASHSLHWGWSMAIGIAVFWLTTRGLSLAHASAQDAYHRAAKIGKYTEWPSPKSN